MKTKTDRAKCLALAKALWPQDDVEVVFLTPEDIGAAPDDGHEHHCRVWSPDYYSESRWGCDVAGGQTREKALAALLKKLRRLATQRQARLAKALEGAK